MRNRRRPRERIPPRLIRGDADTRRRDFDHRLVAPISSSTSYRLGSVDRGVRGFVEFASPGADLRRRRTVEPGGIRLSVGLEDWHDLAEDLRAAFEQI